MSDHDDDLDERDEDDFEDEDEDEDEDDGEEDDGEEDEDEDEEDDDEDDEDEEDDDEDDDDEIAPEGNRIVGARAVAVVEHVARALAEDPDVVDVEVRERRDGVDLLIHAGPGDAGRIIGKRGRVIQALRQVTRAAGSADGVRTTVDVVD